MKNNKVNNKKTILNILLVIFLLVIIALLALYGGSFKDRIFSSLSSNSGNKNLLIFLGYIAVFIGTIVEGETVLFFSCLLCAKGYLSLPGVIIAATFGGSIGDNIYFYLVKDNSEKVISRSKRLSKWYPSVKAMVEKYGGWAVVASRFLIGIRTSIALVCSSGKMPPLKFSLLNLLSASLWSTFFCCAIYYGGKTFEHYFDVFKKFWAIGLPLLILIIIIVIFLKKKLKGNNTEVISEQ